MKSASIPAGEFKSRCLKLLDEVAEKRHTLVVTKRGRPVAQVSPIPQQDDFVGSMQGTGEILADIISPIDAEWEAMK
ncbi:MAG TPA: type II toxin-antitoxin system prevent-host-death family antitoxin [Acidobacteriaceae bacterium]|nr:type II toxin-antitoxin system prevent-host-death family antitoxin [Acidobacteriaceae bacterium]